MLNRKPQILESEVRRFLGDQMAMAEVQALGLQRAAAMQRLMAKIQLLSENEFETAFRAFEAIVENCQNKKASEKPKSKANPDGALEAADRMLTQNQKKSA